jgi:hypothetical protein
MTIQYEAGEKTEHEHEFKTNEKKRILVGVSKSLEVGLNLQIADTIIRTESVWSPGVFEQGMSRVNRPNIKAGVDPRMKTGLHMYYIVADRSIDVLKMARLTSKTVQVAKFYNAGTNDAKYYEGIGLDHEGKPLEPMKISFKNLREGFSFETDLSEYLYAYQDLRKADQTVFDNYRRENPNIGLRPIKHTGILTGSKMLKHIPYTPGMSLFGAEKLGLVPYNEYRRNFIEKHGEAAWDPVGLPVHTEYGDGTIKKAEGKARAAVLLNDGLTIPVPYSVTFVITKKSTNSKEIKSQIAKLAGLEALDIRIEALRVARKKNRADIVKQRKEEREQEKLAQEQIVKRKTSPVDTIQRDKARKTIDKTQIFQEADDEQDNIVRMYLTITNEIFALTLSAEDPDAQLKYMKKYGFVPVKSYLYAQFKQAPVLNQMLEKLDKLNSNGKLIFEDKYYNMWIELYEEFKNGKAKLLNIKQKTRTDIGHFLMDRRRRISNPLEIRPIPLVVDNKLYMCFDLATHAPQAIQAVKRVKPAGVVWGVEKPSLVAFMPNKSMVKTICKQMQDDGYTIENLDEIKETYGKLKTH